jgi:hypothetical protein
MFTSTILTGCRAILSPQKNPCRVRIPALSGVASTYRYDPYLTNVVPSPFKTPLTPTTTPETVELQAAPLHRNSLFAASRSFLQTSTLEEAVAAPAAAAEPEAADKPRLTHYAIVNFKHDSVTYIAPFRLSVGDHVFVEGDRGEDIGVVTEITTETPSYPVPCKVVRRASTRDKEQLAYKQQKEEATIKQVQQLADSLGMSIRIADTEFQFDMNKLTVFFESKSGHIDFRKLQRGLFREYRCRIWLSNMAEIEHNNRMQKLRRTR